jgi:hypothetical protein
MKTIEAVEMLRAMRDDKPFAVDFSLQWSSTGGLTIQRLVSTFGLGLVVDFFERLALAEPPEYAADGLDVAKPNGEPVVA